MKGIRNFVQDGVSQQLVYATPLVQKTLPMLQLFSKKNGEINLTHLSPGGQRNLITGASVAHGSWPHGQVFIQEIRLSRFRLRFMEVSGKAPDSIYFIDEPESVMFHVQLQGTSQLEVDGLDNNSFHEQAYNYYYVPERTSKLTVRKNCLQQYLQIKVPLEYLEARSGEFPFIDRYISAIRLYSPSRLMRYNQVSCAFMLDKIEQIQQGAQLQDVEHLVDELLLFAIQKMSFQPKRKMANYSQAEVDRIYLAKNLLLSELERNYTLSELAQKVGVNVFKLKRGFLEIFGTTAHAIQHGRRMKVAANLLHDDRRFTMAEIAGMVGYDAGESFVRAFKKYYGDYPVAHRSKRANEDG